MKKKNKGFTLIELLAVIVMYYTNNSSIKCS